MPSSNQPLSPVDRLAALRIMDANFNRGMEGLRVLEEYCRFGLDDGHLTKCWKEVRHVLADQQTALPQHQLLVARDTPGDVGVVVKTAQEFDRGSLRHIAQASCKRVEQAIRSLEEYAKVLHLPADKLEQLRYQVYTLEKATLLTACSRERLEGARLYILIDGCASSAVFTQRAREICQAGAHIIQLRDKNLSDRELLERGHALREITKNSGTLFILNDRPDLAVLSQADGVHVGQEELKLKDVRRIVGPEMFIGVSTHKIEQARQAVLDGANYIGCGPTFPSGTKKFDSFPGLPFLREVAAEISLPAFAIGGIDTENISQVLQTGLQRVAASGAVAASENPAVVIRRLSVQLSGGTEGSKSP